MKCKGGLCVEQSSCTYMNQWLELLLVQFNILIPFSLQRFPFPPLCWIYSHATKQLHTSSIYDELFKKKNMVYRIVCLSAAIISALMNLLHDSFIVMDEKFKI